MYRYLTPFWGLALALAVSGSLLAGAHYFEHAQGLSPCILCLDQREVHWVALCVAAAALACSRYVSSETLATAGLGALAIIYGFSTGLAAYHAGVEWGWFEGPMSCSAAMATSGSGAPSGAAVWDSLAQGTNAVPCNEAAWRMAGISMAGYNALISLGLTVIAGTAAYAARRAGKEAPDPLRVAALSRPAE